DAACNGVPAPERRGGKRRVCARPTRPVSCARATGAAPARTAQQACLGGQPCSAVRRPLPDGGCIAPVVLEVMKGSSPRWGLAPATSTRRYAYAGLHGVRMCWSHRLFSWGG